ncbi:MAG: fatty acid--CoA ligase [Deltaproteobacteria bacterium]|nr:fatty acid--CoA ligase [Deltaproteobacteria bacterium]
MTTINPRQIPKTPSAYMYPLLIKQLLHTPIRYSPDQEIVYRDQKRLTYRDFYNRINRLASGLSSLGIGPQDTVAVLDWDSHRYLECFFTIPMMGAIIHTVNVRLSPEQILYTMNHAGDTAVLVHEDFLPLIENIAPQVSTLKSIILLKDGDQAQTSSLVINEEYEHMLDNASDSYVFPDFDENTHATLFYTTGTTGDPKGCYYSHRQLTLHTLGMSIALAAFSGPVRFQSADVYMPLTPMFHAHAWGMPYLATMMGCKQVYPGRYEPATILKMLVSEKVTFSHCVPTILHMIISSPEAKNADLSSWKIIIGGSALPKGLAKASLERGIDVTSAYGMKGSLPLLTMANLTPEMMTRGLEAQLEIRTKTGRPVPLVNLKIIDPDGNAVAADGASAGEIVVRAPWLTQGYLKAPEKSEELWHDGWLHTGDVAVMDSEGYVRVTDRFKDIIKTGGEWISSLELESVISQHPGISEVAVIGVPHEKWGERPAVLVVLRQESKDTFSVDDLRSFLQQMVDKGQLSKWAIPDSVLIVHEIAKTSVGKIDKKLIRKKMVAGDYSSAS